MLERAAIIDHDDLGARTAQGRAKLLEQDRLARPRLAADGDVVVARPVLERRPPEGLAAAADKQKMRHGAAEIFALHRRDIGRRGRKHRAHALQPQHVVRQPIGEAQGEGCDQALELEKAFVGEIPARRLEDRLDHPLVRIALAERRIAGEPVEQLHQLLAGLQLALDMPPLRRLVGKLGQETRAFGLAEARGAHELVARARRGRLLVGIDQAQHGRGRTGKPQLVGEHVADEARAFPRRPALGERAHGKVAQIEAVGQAFADFGMASAVAANLTEPLGSEHHPVVLDLELDVAADRLDVDLLERIPAFALGFAGRGRRGQFVDQPDQRRGPQRMGFKAQRMDEAQEPLAAFGEFGIGDMRAFWHAQGDDQTAAADMEGRVRRTALPDEIVEPGDPFARDRLIDAALFVAGGEPRRDDLPDAGARKIEHLQAGALG